MLRKRSQKFFVLFFLLLLSVGFTSAAPISKVYNIEFVSNGSEVVLFDLNLKEGLSNVPLDIFSEDYIVKIISHEETVYQEYPVRFYFDVSKSVSDECFVAEGTVEMLDCGGSSHVRLNESVVVLNIPFSPNAKFLRLYTPDGAMILQKDISGLACGNNVCDSHESEDGCMQDCARSKFMFEKAMLILGLILFIVAMLTFIFWEYISEEKKFKEKMFHICRWLKNVGINSISNN